MPKRFGSAQRWLALLVVAVICIGFIFSRSRQAPRSWTIGPSAVGEVVLGERPPLFSLTLSPRPYHRLVFDGVPELGLRLGAADLEVAIGFLSGRVIRIYPGPEMKTAGGVGLGSTLEELRETHGAVELYNIPEPYHCAVTSSALPDVYFHFADCDAAKAGEGIVHILVWRNLDP